MYEAFYGLTEKPFSLTPNPRYVFYSEHYRAALDHLLYGLHEKEGFMLLTGMVGTGKTTLCRELLDRLNRFLLSQLIDGKTCVAIFDEAQHLSAEFLEQIRVLSNLETDKEKLVQILLVGQPELRE